MGLFSFTQEIAMDLGTANTIITTNGKIVVDEPSVVALDRRTDKMIAVGDKAKMMHEKTHENIRTIRPLRDGVIADFYACEQMIRGLIKMVNNRNRLFSPSLRMVIGVPSGSTEVELRAVRDSAEHAGGRDVYLIFEPMAAAIGIGIDVEAPEGNMIVDIGGGSTEIAVISLGGIVANNSIRIAGDDLTADIQEYMSRQHNVKVSERMAERIKINVGAVELIYFLSEFHHAFIAVRSVQCSEINAVEQEFLDLLRMVSGHFFCNDFRYLGSYFRIVQLCVVLCQCGIILVLVRFILLHGLAI